MHYDKNHPFLARLALRQPLTPPEAGKETCHFVIDIAGSGLTYACGDSLGVYPTNDPALVDACLRALQLDPATSVTLPMSEDAITLHEALSTRLCLATVSKRLLKSLRAHNADPAEAERLDSLLAPDNSAALESYLACRHVIDLLEDFPATRCPASEIVRLLRKLAPRLYSIASSPTCYPNEIHLTVAVVRYEMNERPRHGVASTYLAERADTARPVLPVYIAPSKFRLPENDATDLIMVGPGTGIAPFRSFLQEREARGARGRHWLFFGERHEATCFLYGETLRAWQDRGLLTHLTTAFSRDQEEKLYVQHRLRAHAAEVWEWLRDGASFYVCGDASGMAVAVDAALHDIVREQGGLDEEDARSWIKMLRLENRYQRDVY